MLKTNLYLSLIFFIIISCNSSQIAGMQGPAGYDLNKPIVWNLPLQLDEISGLAYNENDSSLFAIADDSRLLFKIQPGRKISTWKFKGGQDYEDIVVVDSTFYILESSGNIISLLIDKSGKSLSEEYEFPKEFGKGEFESMYKDPITNNLVLVCKDCSVDNKKTITAYTFNTYQKIFTDSTFQFDFYDKGNSKFKASAASYNPFSKTINIIASVNKTLLVADLNGKLIQQYPLNRSLFKQPEGIAFAPNGDMYISNEYAGTGAPQILFYKRSNTNK